MKVNECMSRNVRFCSPTDTIGDVARTMREVDAGSLPVGENDRLIGMITDRDIVVRAVAEGKGWETPVREVMTRDIHYVFEDEELEDVSAKMSDLKIRRLPVLSRQKRMIGIVSLGDLWSSDECLSGAEALSHLAEHTRH